MAGDFWVYLFSWCHCFQKGANISKSRMFENRATFSYLVQPSCYPLKVSLSLLYSSNVWILSSLPIDQTGPFQWIDSKCLSDFWLLANQNPLTRQPVTDCLQYFWSDLSCGAVATSNDQSLQFGGNSCRINRFHRFFCLH